VLPGPERFYGPRWSADGRYLLAHALDFGKLVLFNFATRKWVMLVNGNCHFGNWSRDDQYVYFERWEKNDITAVRIWMSDRKQERIGNVKQFRPVAGPERCWGGLAPDDSLLVLRDISTQEIYALEWEAP